MKRYIWAVVSAILASVARVLLDRALGYHHPYATFYIAVLWSAWYGGLGPALVTTSIGAVAAILFVIPPGLVAAQGTGALVGFEFYFLVTLTGAILLHAQRNAQRKSDLNAQVARDRLAALERETAQRRQAEEAARQYEEQLRLTFEHAPVGICHISVDGILIDANSRFCDIAGWARDEILGVGFFQMVDAGAQAGAAKEYSDLIAGAKPVQKGEYLMLRKDGSFIQVEVAISVLWVQTGRPRCAVAIVQDISARTRSERELREAQKLESVGLLAGGIAHDFNNLLTGILGNATLALDTLPPESEPRRMLSTVISAARRAAELTSQLLAYAGKGAFTADAVDVSAIVGESVGLVAVSLPPNIEIRLKLRRDVAATRADASQIQQLFTNMLINAGEAIEEGRPGHITITTDTVSIQEDFALRATIGEVRAGCYVLLMLEDNGCGMDEATMRRIFDPFFTTKFMGRGLGLAAVSGIVRAQHGTIVVSSSPGHGSRFSVLLPVVGDQPECAATPGEHYFGNETMPIAEPLTTMRLTSARA